MNERTLALIFDCDGVIFDSNELKNVAFAQAVGLHFDQPTVDAFLTHHRENGGVSRYVKFRHLFEGILRRPVDEPLVARLLQDFSESCLALYDRCAFTQGALDCLHQLAGKYRLYVASGSDEVELRTVFQRRGISSLFEDVLGSPRAKPEIVGSIAEGGGPVAAMVGDAVADFRAASQHGVTVVLMPTYSDAKNDVLALAAETGTPTIESLQELPMLLDSLRGSAA